MRKRVDPNTSILWGGPSHGFMSRFGPEPYDWEESLPHDSELDEYEARMLKYRRKK